MKTLLKRLAIVVIPLIIAASAISLYAQAPRATLARLKGTVKIKKLYGGWQDAKKGAPLEEGDIIRTGRGSSATVNVIDAGEITNFTIDGATETSVEALLVDNLTDRQDSTVKLNRGHLKVPAKKFDKEASFKIETPNAVIEANKRGVKIRYNTIKASEAEVIK